MNEVKYITIAEIGDGKEYPFTMGQMRSLLQNRKNNGLYKAVRKIGKRLYIRKDLFDEWIERQLGSDDDNMATK